MKLRIMTLEPITVSPLTLLVAPIVDQGGIHYIFLPLFVIHCSLLDVPANEIVMDKPEVI